jgi:endo-1,4-beta-D-glucanase Y
MRDVVVVALGGVALCLFAGCGGTGSTSTPSPGHTPGSGAAYQARAEAASRYFLRHYVDPDGRVVRHDQGGDTVSEGQSYGMLIAAAIGDSRSFDSIWAWTQQHLRTADGLFASHWAGGRVVDPQPASDADLDASRALLVAACRFDRPTLRRQAIALGNSIMSAEVTSFRGETVLTAGPWAIVPRIIIDPSYFDPATFEMLGTASGDSRWDALAVSSRSIVGDLMTAPSRLPPDWALLEGDKIVPVGSPSDLSQPPEFGFDAVRVLIRMAEDPDPSGRRIAARAWPVFEQQDPATMPVYHSLDGRPRTNVKNPVVLVAAAAAADAAGQTAARDGLLDSAEAIDNHPATRTYYGAAWVALGRLMLQTKLLDACSP